MSEYSFNGNKTSNFFSSKSVVISNGKVFIDGKDVTPDSKEINITIEGNVEKLEVEACNKISITGNANNISTQSGDIDIQGSVNGSVSTMSGDVDCGNISGSVSTMSGDIKNRK